jgi:hypothetical protein
MATQDISAPILITVTILIKMILIGPDYDIQNQDHPIKDQDP